MEAYQISLTYPDFRIVPPSDSLRAPNLPDLGDEAYHYPDEHVEYRLTWPLQRPNPRTGPWERAPASWSQDDLRSVMLDAIQDGSSIDLRVAPCKRPRREDVSFQVQLDNIPSGTRGRPHTRRWRLSEGQLRSITTWASGEIARRPGRPIVASIAMVLVQLGRLISPTRTQDFSRVLSALRDQASLHPLEFQRSSHSNEARDIYRCVAAEIEDARAEVLRIRRLAVDRLVRTQPKNGDICAICRTDLVRRPCDEVVRISSHGCQAVYGRECIAHWLGQSPMCPMCRARL